MRAAFRRGRGVIFLCPCVFCFLSTPFPSHLINHARATVDPIMHQRCEFPYHAVSDGGALAAAWWDVCFIVIAYEGPKCVLQQYWIDESPFGFFCLHQTRLGLKWFLYCKVKTKVCQKANCVITFLCSPFIAIHSDQAHFNPKDFRLLQHRDDGIPAGCLNSCNCRLLGFDSTTVRDSKSRLLNLKKLISLPWRTFLTALNHRVMKFHL